MDSRLWRVSLQESDCSYHHAGESIGLRFYDASETRHWGPGIFAYGSTHCDQLSCIRTALSISRVATLAYADL